MCFWLITTCISLLPAQTIVYPGIPAPIITPTTTTTTTTTTPRPITMPPVSLPPQQYLSPVLCATPFAVCTTNPNQIGVAGMMPNTGGMMPTTGAMMPNPGGMMPNPGGMMPYPGGMMPNPGGMMPNIAGMAQQVSPLIDPRLGTTPNPYITGYNGQISPQNSVVNFPRDRRSVGIHIDYKEVVVVSNGRDLRRLVKRQVQLCACVPAGTCPAGGMGNFGNGLIDFRIVTPNSTQCGSGLQYCCTGGTATPTTAPAIACGVRQQVPATTVQPTTGQASFGEFPWQALILTKQNDYIAGGVLIDKMNVVTVTHRLTPYIVQGATPNVKVRLGEWDVAGTYEPVPHQEYTAARAFTHPSYNAATLQYDLAVLRLSTPVPVTPSPGAALTINSVCLPPAATTTYDGKRCWVAGWGKNAFGTSGVYQQILKKVDVPIVAAGACQTSLRTARLGPNFILDTTSFVCAGGEMDKDSCSGDGGSGLVCEGASGAGFTLVGLVAWGLGCGATGVPGAYVNIAALSPWLRTQLATPTT